MRLKTKINEAWFDVPNDPDKTGVLVRTLTPRELAEAQAKAFAMEGVFVRRGKERELQERIRYGQGADQFAVLIASIVDWKNVMDEETGDQVPCTHENKEALVLASPEFREFVADCRKSLAANNAEAGEQAAKN